MLCKNAGGGGLYPRVRVAAIVLAAGESSRMQGINKLLIEVNGVPLIRRTLIGLSGAGVDEVVVVLGHEAQRVQPLVEDFPLTVVVNPDYHEGQMTSVECGLRALTEEFNAVLVAVADQPLLSAGDIGDLIGAYKKRSHGSIVVPIYQGQRGNPIIFDYALRDEMLSGGRNLGCANLIAENPELVVAAEMQNDHFTTDLDTRDDLARLKARLRVKIEAPESQAPQQVDA
jgi:molybdenum cofactor cytidylyltransferase